jgi:hypothetical protein
MSYNYTINIGKTVINVTQNPLDDILSANNLIHNMMTGYLMFSHKRIKQATTITSLHSSQQHPINCCNSNSLANITILNKNDQITPLYLLIIQMTKFNTEFPQFMFHILNNNLRFPHILAKGATSVNDLHYHQKQFTIQYLQYKLKYPNYIFINPDNYAAQYQ